MLKTQVITEIQKVLGNDQFKLLEPKDSQWGDFALFIQNGAWNIEHGALMKELMKNNLFSKVEQKGRYINFFINPEILVDELNKINGEKDNYGQSDNKKNNKIMVEFAHPNTHKAFHIGHLRNIITGEAIARLLESQGTNVIRANYQGDVGMHIAKALYALLQNPEFKIQNSELKTLEKKVEFLGKAYATGSKAFEENDETKREIAEINKKIYAKDSEIYPLYQQTRQWSLDYFDAIYKRVDSYFDRLYFESEVYESGKKLVNEGLRKGIFEKSEGAIIFPGEKYGLHNRVFITSDDNPTYEAKDMGLGQLQFTEYNPDKIIHVVGPEQTEYFKVVFEALAQLFPKIKNKELHLIYGWFQLKHGKMSSRLGNVITGQWLLDTVKKQIKTDFKVDDDIAEILTIAAVKYSFLKSEMIKNISFDIDESISLSGNSGPYILYTYARCKSILSKAKSAPRITNYQLPITDQELSLLRTFIKYPEVVSQAATKYSPHLICNYVFDLCQKFSYFYEKSPILKAGDHIRDFRLKITVATAQIIKNSLDLLGIKTVDRL